MIYILRGPSGCGKSTFAKRLKKPSTVILSADDYFTTISGEYHFDASKLGEAHGQCLRKYAFHVRSQYEDPTDDYDIIIDNTNITDAELAPYVRIAQAYELPFKIVEFTKQWRDHRGLGNDRYLSNLDRMSRETLFDEFVAQVEEFQA